MPATKHDKLPTRFDALVDLMPPQALTDDDHYEDSTEMIGRLMAIPRLSRDQALYMETLVQLVQAYEAAHHTIDAPRGLGTLRHLLAENDMNASDLARLLGVHTSMGSKILNGERALTVEHLKKLSARFHLRPDAFMD